MQKITRTIFALLFSFGLIFFVQQNESLALCNNLWGNCGTTISPYCDGKDSSSTCSLSGGVSAVKKAIGTTLTDKPLSVFAQEIVQYLLSFISLIAVLYIIYAGFQVMIGGGDEEKAKKAKNIIIYVILGIGIMWLAYAIVKWTINLVEGKPRASILWMSIPETHAAYTENELDTFSEYQNKLRIAIQTIQGEIKVNKAASVSSLQNLKNLLQGAYDRLPDTGKDGTENDTAKRSIDTDIDVAIKNPATTSYVNTALGNVATFISSARIGAITGDIVVSPSEGNAPLISSFRATNIKDPSGTSPESQNYIWWMRGNGGKRIELGRGPSLNYTFTQEGTFTISLDVVSSSRNTKGRIDVLPLSVSKQVEVKPKLGEIILLINGVNVSNIQSLKVSPNIGKMGILLDATASRAVGNGSITETSWDFGNGNTISYKGGPVVERQLYANQGSYPVKLTIKTNTEQTFTKEFQLIVRDPSAVIQIENPVGHIGESMNFSSLSYFTTQNNVEYGWQIQNEDNKKVLKSAVGPTLSHKFDTIGSYIVTLTSRSPNGNIDTDSRVVTIESRDPVINMTEPRAQSAEKPNTILFDASKSYDPDTMSRKGLTFTWRLNGERVNLENLEQDGSKGTLKFDTTGNNTISLTVANAYGKVTTIEKVFEVTSILAVNMVITPTVAPIGTTISFIGQSENAGFYEWDMGDGSVPINGTKKVIQHTYNKTGIYRVTLTVKSRDGLSNNKITKNVYVSDTNSPYANINISNGSNSVYEDSTACKNGAIVINRSESTNFDASRSINIDGSTDGLSYTWEYFGKVKTTPYLSEKFSELGCFPIKLTVRSGKNGASHTTTQYISLRNQPPELTSITTSVDSTKKDAQKILVKVTANGVRDPDGVITSYIWYYTTESDKEAQNVQITQKNEITFVLPNITEKYYFGVIIEDNDGGRKNSIDDGIEQAPLLVDNQNGNIYLPLISLSAPKIGLAGEKIRMSVEAKTIVGTNITNKAEYAWDFDGDGKIDQKTQTPTVDYVYKNSGTYSFKVRVTHNGVSNTKYQTIAIKNPLKAAFYGYRLQNGDIYLLNASKGPYDKVSWNIGSELTESLYSIRIPASKVVSGTILGKLTISSNDSDADSVDIDIKDVRDMTGTGVAFQTSPLAIDNTIHVTGPGEKVLLSLIGNTATRYAIDEDTSIDSDLDGVSDNDIDNKDTPSYTDGSIYSFQDFSPGGSKTRGIRISLFDGNTKIHTEDLTLIFDYIQTSSVSGEGFIALSNENLSESDKKELDILAGLIRSTSSENRIILMQQYNTLIENWDDPFSKAKTLIDLQEKIEELGLSNDTHAAFAKSIDTLLIGDAESTDEITIAVKLIEGLIPQASSNRTVILEKLDAIKSHPKLLSENKILGKDILKLIEVDDSIETKYKIHIKNQLNIIVNGGQEGVNENEIKDTETSSGGFLGFIGGIVKIFFLILGIIALVILIGYIFYRISRKNTDIGFQDFLIDSVFHSKRNTTDTSTSFTEAKGTKEAPINIAKEVVPVDPLTAYTPVIPTDPLLAHQQEQATQVISSNQSDISSYSSYEKMDPLVSQGGETVSGTPIIEEAAPAVPEWLKASTVSAPATTPEVLPEVSTSTFVAETTSDTSFSPQDESISQQSVEISPHNPISQSEEVYNENISTTIPENPEDVLLVKEETAEDVLLVKEDIPGEQATGEMPQESVVITSNISSGDTLLPISLEETTVNPLPPAPTPMERDPNMPDWLSLDPINPKTSVETPPTSDTTESTLPGTDIPNGGSASTSENLPDWLVQSVKQSEKEEEKPEEGTSLLDIIDEKDGKKPKVKKESSKKKEKEEGKQKSPPHDNIPDWLK